MKGLKRIEERDVAYQLDGLRFTLYAVRIAFARIEDSCRALEMKFAFELTFLECFNMLSDCWLVIDQTDRARTILESIKGFRAGKSEKHRFLKTSGSARDFRNTFQHFGSKAKNIPDKSPSMMGSLCWVAKGNPLYSYAVLLNSGAVESSFPSLTFDLWEGRFVNDFQFNAAGKSISISALAVCCIEYADYIEEFLARHEVHSDGGVAGMIIGFGLEVPADGTNS